MTLILFYGIPDKWLLVVAAILFLGTGRYLSFILSGPSDFFFRELLPGQSTTLAYVETLRDGSLSEVFRLNLTEGSFSRLSLQFGLLGRGYLTLAYFLVGLWLMRSGVMRALLDYKNAIRNTLLWSLLMAALFYFLFRLSMYYLPQPWNYSSWPVVAVFTFYDLTNIATTAIFVCGFLLLFLHKPGWQWVKLASYGRLALSNYLLQTLVGTFIFYGWGLGLLGQLHDWQTFLLGVLIVLLQVWLSIWWLSRFRYGPAEWLWRCMTYFKVLPFRGSRQVPGAT